MRLVFREHLFTEADAHQNQAKTDRSVASQNSYRYPRNQSSKILTLRYRYRLTNLPTGQVDKLNGHHHTHPLSRSLGMGGLPQKREKGGGGILRSEHQTGSRRSIIPNHLIYQSGFPNKFSD
jgi:hypothetical protein